MKLRPVLDSNFVMRQDKLVRLDEEFVRKEQIPEENLQAEEEVVQVGVFPACLALQRGSCCVRACERVLFSIPRKNL